MPMMVLDILVPTVFKELYVIHTAHEFMYIWALGAISEKLIVFCR